MNVIKEPQILTILKTLSHLFKTIKIHQVTCRD